MFLRWDNVHRRKKVVQLGVQRTRELALYPEFIEAQQSEQTFTPGE